MSYGCFGLINILAKSAILSVPIQRRPKINFAPKVRALVVERRTHRKPPYNRSLSIEFSFIYAAFFELEPVVAVPGPTLDGNRPNMDKIEIVVCSLRSHSVDVSNRKEQVFVGRRILRVEVSRPPPAELQGTDGYSASGVLRRAACRATVGSCAPVGSTPDDMPHWRFYVS